MKFADYLKEKRIEKGITLRKFAQLVGVAPSYLSDIEKEKRNPPSPDIIEKMVKTLNLSSDDAKQLYDLAVEKKDTVAVDIANYITSNSAVKAALRRAKELNFNDEDWLKIIEEMEKKK